MVGYCRQTITIIIIIAVHPWLVENPGQKAGCDGQQVFTSSAITRHSLNQTQGETRQEMGEIAQKIPSF